MSRSAALVAGVDGCPSGWVAVVGPPAGGTPWMSVAPSFAELMHRHPRVSHWAIDIPIGLSDDRSRDADRLARRWLGPNRGSSVFPVPPRGVSQYVDRGGADYVEACRLAAESTGKKISKQAWFITPKIAEVRRFLIENKRLRDRAFECHPELCFARLNHGAALASGKKTEPGSVQRKQLLRRVFGAESVERLVRQTEFTRGVGLDDTLDAMACWTAAARVLSGQSESLPDQASRDADGLMMAIRW